ncbi:MAG: hypothetical protein WBF06_04740 [Candidatus Acidiferrales bacterium]
MENSVASAALPSLLWTALGGLERAYILEGAGGDGMPSLDLWANLLRALNVAGTDRRELPAIVRLSKRAVRSRMSVAARNGWVEELKLGRDPATVRLTARGSVVATRWTPLQHAAEERWRAEVGAERTSKLRASLEQIATRLPLEHPHYPASYGAADASITGGNGRDWKAVPRQNGNSVSDLALSALLSQALVAFAMNYEKKSPVALSLSLMVIKRIPLEGRPLQGLGPFAGISALDRHGFVRLSGSKGGEIIYLTRKGVAVKDAHDERIQAVETEWRKAFGNEPVTALRRALEDVADAASHSTKAR